MTYRVIFMAGLLGSALLMVSPAMAEILLKDAYARSASPNAKAGAAFMMIENTGVTADRLISASSDAAKRVEIHTHRDVDGVMQMRELEDGIEIPAGGMRALKRGGDHVMFMGLNESWSDGDMIPVVLTFESGLEIATEIPVDLQRKPDAHGGHANH